MRRTEIILTLLVVAAGIAFYFNLALSGIALVVSVTSMAVLYYLGPLLFNDIRLRDATKSGAFDNVPLAYLILGFIAGQNLSLLCIGMLFKLMLWPGSEMLLRLGFYSLGGWLVVIFAFSLRFKGKLLLNYLKRAIPIGGLALIMYFMVPFDAIIDQHHSDDPELAEALKAQFAHPDDEEIRKEAERLREDRLKKWANPKENGQNDQ